MFQNLLLFDCTMYLLPLFDLCNLARLVGKQNKQFSYSPNKSSPQLPLLFASVNQFLFLFKFLI